jgi:CRP-like cAMP-binding protein
MGKGESFGDYCLLENKPRSASIIAKKATTLLVLHRHDFNAIIGQVQYDQMAEKLDFLHKLPMFTEWSKLSITRLCYHFMETRFWYKKVVFWEGERADGVYFIKSGEF